MSAYMHIIREYVGTPSQIPTGRNKMLNRPNPDKPLKPSQTVRVVRTVSVAYDMLISDYLDGEDNLDGRPITVGNLEEDISDNTAIMDVLDEYDNAEVTDIKVEIYKIY